MDIISTVIDMYFGLMKSLNVRNISIAILALIIGIEFLEFFSEKNEKENIREKITKKKPDIKKILGLGGERTSMLHIADNAGVSDTPKTVTTSNHPSYEQRPSLRTRGFASKERAEVIGSRTYTIRTVLDGNHIFLEKVEG